MRIYKAKTFARFTRRERITDVSLCEAIEQAERGLVNADLGGGLIKLRLARPGYGKRGGYRMLIAFGSKLRVVFLFGFAKSELDNINKDQLATLRETAALWLTADAPLPTLPRTRGRVGRGAGNKGWTSDRGAT